MNSEQGVSSFHRFGDGHGGGAAINRDVKGYRSAGDIGGAAGGGGTTAANAEGVLPALYRSAAGYPVAGGVKVAVQINDLVYGYGAAAQLAGCSGQGVSQVFVRSGTNEDDVSIFVNVRLRVNIRTGNSYQPVLASWYGGVYTYGDDADWLGRCRCLGSISGNNCRRQVNVRLAGVVPTGTARRGVAIGEDNDEVGVQ
ncbi:hypothetical protein ES703_112934 [subsurface metagenome]